MDLIFCDGFGRKVWARHRSKVTNETPYLVSILSTINDRPNDNNENEGAIKTTEALVEPVISIFLIKIVL